MGDDFLTDTFLGDPSIFGNLDPCSEIVNSVLDCIRNGKYNGYGPSTGDFIQRTV